MRCVDGSRAFLLAARQSFDQAAKLRHVKVAADVIPS
jgi:hypothetical protein